MNNVLVALGVLVVAILGALFAVPRYVDWNAYRGVIEEEASRVVGRDVRIGGTIQLELLPAPSFVINKLRIADVGTLSGEPMFRADRVAARLSIAPLLKGVLEANEIELVKPVLRLVLDETGRGNWRTLGGTGAQLSFMPDQLALQSVKITDGALQVLDRDGARERLSLPLVNGQLSAPALEGPYRFRGTYGPAPHLREVRFASQVPTVAGAVQIKGTLRDLASSATLTLDGTLAELAGEPTLVGELSATWPLPNPSKVQPVPAGAPATPGPPPQAEFKSTIAGDSRRLAFKNLSVAFENAGRPEVLSGEASLAWGIELVTTLRLTAPWLDLDPVLGTAKGASPLAALASFAQRITTAAVDGGIIDATLDIDQASLGYDLVGGIRLAAKSRDGVVLLDEVRANLPGGTVFEAQGRVAGREGAPIVDGDLTLKTRSLARLGTWLSGGRALLSVQHDRGASVRGRFAVEGDRLNLQTTDADIGDGPLEARLDYAWSQPPKIALSLEGVKIDARVANPPKATLRSLSGWLASAGSSEPGQAETRPELAVRLRTNELILSEGTLRDVTAALTWTRSALLIEKLNLSAGNGVSVALDQSRLDGGLLDLKGAVSAATETGLRELADVFGVEPPKLPDSVMRGVLPLQLAGTFTKAAAQTAPIKLVADGRLGRADAKVRATLDGGADGWRTAPADIDVVLLGPLLGPGDPSLLGHVLAWVRGSNPTAALPQGPLDADLDANAARSRLALRLTGRAADGLSTVARYDTSDTSAVFDGRSRLVSGKAPEITGDLRIETTDGRGLVGAATNLDAARLPVLAGAGTLRLDVRGSALTLSDIALAAGPSETAARITGRIVHDLDPAAGGRSRLSGALRLPALDVSTLLAPILQNTSGSMAAAVAAQGSGRTVWPTAAIDFGAPASPEIDMTIETDQLWLGSGSSLSAAKFAYGVGAQRLEIRDFTALALGGAATARILLTQSPKGATLSATLTQTAAKLDAFGASSTANATVELAGDGASPAVLVAGLAGRGTLSLGAAQIREITPATLRAALDASLKAAPDKVGATLRAQLAQDSARGAIALGPRNVPVIVKDGIASSDPIAINTAGGKAIALGSLDLASFILSGQWRVETTLPPFGTAASAQSEPLPSPPLPPVVQRFQLTPSDLLDSRPASRSPLELEALERELAVRKVERDLAELERLRRSDEERAAVIAREKEAQAAADAAQVEATRAPEPKQGARGVP